MICIYELCLDAGVVNFGELLDAWARVDAAVEGVIGGFDDASGLAVALLSDQICDSYSLASSADADVRIAISAAVTLSLSTVFSLIDSDGVSFWAVDVAIVFGVCGLVSNFADWRVDSDFSTFHELFFGSIIFQIIFLRYFS